VLGLRGDASAMWESFAASSIRIDGTSSAYTYISQTHPKDRVVNIGADGGVWANIENRITRNKTTALLLLLSVVGVNNRNRATETR